MPDRPAISRENALAVAKLARRLNRIQMDVEAAQDDAHAIVGTLAPGLTNEESDAFWKPFYDELDAEDGGDV